MTKVSDPKTLVAPAAFHRARRAVWLALLLPPLLWLGGCTAQFFYNRLDTILHLYLSAQVSLEAPQSRALKGALGEYLAWHRRSELPRYAQFAADVAKEARESLSRERIDAARIALEAFWRDSVLRGAPEAARWLAQLSAAQRTELFESLADDDEDLREEFCEADQAVRRSKRRVRRFISTAENWVGRLDAAQRALVEQRLAQLEPTGCQWVEQRLATRDELRRVIDSAPTRSAADYEAEFAKLLSRPEERWDPSYRARFDANRERIVDLLAELDAQLEPRQRARLVSKFESWERDFRELAAAPVP